MRFNILIFLVISNLILSFCVIIGTTIWSSQFNIYLVYNGYGLSWFISFTSFITGIFGYIYHTTPSIRSNTRNRYYGLYGMIIYTLIITSLWFISMTINLDSCKDCIKLKNMNFDITCTGLIIISIFTTLSTLLWLIITIDVYKYTIKKFSSKNSITPARNNTNIIPNPEIVTIELQPTPEPEIVTIELQPTSEPTSEPEIVEGTIVVEETEQVENTVENTMRFNMRRCESPLNEI